MRRLRCRMDDDLDRASEFLKNRVHGIYVANVDRSVPIFRELLLEFYASRKRGSVLPKEFGAHVVVDSDHVETFSCEPFASLRADQSGRARHKGNAHD